MVFIRFRRSGATITFDHQVPLEYIRANGLCQASAIWNFRLFGCSLHSPTYVCLLCVLVGLGALKSPYCDSLRVLHTGNDPTRSNILTTVCLEVNRHVKTHWIRSVCFAILQQFFFSLLVHLVIYTAFT